MKPFITLSLIGLFTLLFSFAQETPTNPDKSEKASESEPEPLGSAINVPPLVRVQVEHIEVSHKALTRLLMEDKAETTDATSLRMKVQELVDKDEAKILDTSIATGRSGDKSSSVSREEFIYPTEYEHIDLHDKDKEKIDQAKADVIAPLNYVFPLSFETRNLGSSLDIEPRIGDDNTFIDLRFLSEINWHTGNSVCLETENKLGNHSTVTMPRFYGLYTDTSIICIPGQYLFVSVLSPKNAEGKLDTEKKVMVFVKCKILPVVP